MLTPIRELVEVARKEFASLLRRARISGPLSVQQYQRYLSMQYHLTKGVQMHFMCAAGHSDLAKRKSLRKFLYTFANEEEQHYLVAANDLISMGLEILPRPLDVILWHSYFDQTVDKQPFLRLGPTCILENISGGAARSEVQEALRAPFLASCNTKFLVLHQHETLPHGDQILAALEAAHLEPKHVADLVAGAKLGMVMYLRMAEWALFPNCLSAQADSSASHHCNDHEKMEIELFDMDQLHSCAG